MSALAGGHLALLAAALAALALLRPAAMGFLASALACALAALLAARRGPPRWRRLAIPELLLAAGLAAAWWWWRPPWLAAAAAAGACLLLVPARPGVLPHLAAGSALALLAAGMGSAPPSAAATAGACLVACAALASAAWFADLRGARLPRRPRGGPPWLRWCAWPSLAAAVLGLALAAAAGLDRRDPLALPPRLPGTGEVPAATRGSGLDSTLHIGALQRIVPDHRVVAVLEPAPPGGGPVYLRAEALPRLRCQGGALLWMRGEGPLVAAPGRPLPPPTALLWRQAGDGDVVLRPDGGAAADLGHLLEDGDGNRYRPGLGDAPCAYAVSLAAPPPEPEAGDPGRWRRLPAELLAQGWEAEADPAWATAAPDTAAAAIVARLAQRCSYALDRLPPAGPAPGSALRTFLADPDPARRRGHCQHFATAAAVLLRLAGHPARVVVGYAAAERDAAGRLVVRARDAHAWCEVLDAARRWRRVEATPPGSLAARDAVLAPAPAAATAPAPPPPAIRPLPAATPVAPAAAPPLAAEGRRAAGLGLLLAGAGLLALAWRRRRRRAAGGAARDGDLVALARRLGVAVGPATTLSQVAAGLAERTGIDLAGILAAHLAARFGGGPPPPPWPFAALRRAAAQRRRTSAAGSAP